MMTTIVYVYFLHKQIVIKVALCESDAHNTATKCESVPEMTDDSCSARGGAFKTSSTTSVFNIFIFFFKS